VDAISDRYRPHWYKNMLIDCPVCGGFVKRKRIYGEKPEDIKDRWETVSSIYCGCLGRI
jgi:hypothetical protein